MWVKFASYFPQKSLLVIEIAPTACVVQLLEAITAEFHSLGRKDINAKNLLVLSLENSKLTFDRRMSLKPSQTLQTRALQWLHQHPAEKRCGYPHCMEDDPHERGLEKALDQRLSRLPPADSPSDIVHSPDKLAGLLGGYEHLVHVGRLGGAPAVIFSPALSALQIRLDHLDRLKVSPREVHFAAQVCTAAGGIKFFIIQTLELKTTLGLSGDAISQAIVDYSKIPSRKPFKKFRAYCNFPTVLIDIGANHIVISVAVCVGSIYVTKLLTLDLSMDLHASENIICVARVFKALKLCRHDLEEYYDDVLTLSAPKFSALFPNPTPVDPSQTLPKLKYKQSSKAGQPISAPVDLGDACTSIYTTTLDDADERVVVKFTPRYNEFAHRLLAAVGLAPGLHFCGRVVGGLYMGSIDAKSIWQHLRDKSPIPSTVWQKVEKTFKNLHRHDIAFGDLREQNILYDPFEDRVFLVDFDWPGQDGESRYPVTINTGLI